MQLDTLLRKADVHHRKANPNRAEKTLEVAELSQLWAVQKEICPPLDWFPPPLQQNWQWVPAAVKGTTQNLLLLFHGLGDTPGTIANLSSNRETTLQDLSLCDVITDLETGNY